MSWWSKLNKREQGLIILLLVVILPVAFYFYFYQPLQQQIEVKEQKLKRLRTDLEAEKSLAENKQQLQTRYKTVKQQLINQQQLVTRETLADLIVELNRLADDNELSLLALKPQERKQAQPYLQYPVVLQLSGSYQKLLNYLEDIYQLDYLVRVERIAFSTADSFDSNSTGLQMGVKVVGYTPAESSASKGD